METVTSGSLIQDPLAIFVFLLALVALIFGISEWKPLKRFFHFFPPLIFCYFLPMAATTFGVIPQASPLYSWFNKVFLCPILVLLLLSADLRTILRLGPVALGIMVAGSLGIVGGAVLGYAIFGSSVDPQGWKNIGALAASWTGGSANMFAVKAALSIPDEVFSPMIIVDSVMAYTWLGLLISLSGFQSAYARRFRVNKAIEDDIEARVAQWAESSQRPATTRDLLLILGVGMVGGYLCTWGGAQLYEKWKAAAPDSRLLAGVSASTLGVVLATTLGVVAAFTPLRRLEQVGASRVGYAMLYLLLPTFGAQANLREFGQIPYYAAIGAIMLALHGIFVVGVMMLCRAPLVFGAVASQANVGGPASASIVASSFRRELAPLGVLLGILGGIVGTYAGLLTAQICSLFAPR
ncbi:MAG: DUF819 family protein [Candidatus Hydrogenedentota bacterium]|uniref:DUF819 domain-containing protein n=1 Tax=Sumerlaea chitinivorans TaxID=2250252 RepID=A0A2Z4Y7L1_SUMC1|nr:DUF819 domain-containing protein [Candidatus Sumerlaea chitinivorans]RMH29156.1 MAG: DUF819 family protein [Candidatus Hydrogenedentota bacterium]GIX43901.1 MAG: hypothetical protein KatS3mg130_0309 [Candidatus Sumerlaea sp.]